MAVYSDFFSALSQPGVEIELLPAIELNRDFSRVK